VNVRATNATPDPGSTTSLVFRIDNKTGASQDVILGASIYMRIPRVSAT